ncbi:MAG: hypothetical protein K8W52_41455 [Deltaproteobacteria bacterium]|nr:hypothetical protein [Deltaproteobacteria bacterium]
MQLASSRTSSLPSSLIAPLLGIALSGCSKASAPVAAAPAAAPAASQPEATAPEPTASAPEPGQLDRCARLYVISSACGYAWGGGDIPGFYKEPGVKARSLTAARAECAKMEGPTLSDEAAPPVPFLDEPTLSSLERAKARSCAAFRDAFATTSAGLIEDKPFEP